MTKNRQEPRPADPRRVKQILRRLKKAYPHATTALQFSDPLQLLVATILSAQCTDERVNQVTAQLFKNYRAARDYADAPPGQLEQDIKPTGYFRNKARSIRGACRKIVEEFGGQVPRTMEELLTLPGVARKTANVVLGNAFGMASGIVVDTHVLRVSQRLGLTRNTIREKVEQDLMSLIPKDQWIDVSHRLILHGRRVCQARKPRCPECVLANLCPARREFYPDTKLTSA